MPRNSQAGAAQTRGAVLDGALDIGSTEGLLSVSIGRLADALGMSKSGVIGPFGSKEKLQLATLHAAIERFREEVWEPVERLPVGVIRLRALIASWIGYLEREVFPGGCFLTAVSLEFDDRPGAVRDAVAATWSRWLAVIEGEVEAAQRAGALAEEPGARQVALQLNAYVMAGNWAKQLYGGDDALAPTRVAVAALIG